MRNYPEEVIEQVKTLGGLFLNYREVAVLISDYSFDELLEDLTNPFHPLNQSYFLGATQSKKDIRVKVVSLAKLGSPQAEALADKYIQDFEIDRNVK